MKVAAVHFNAVFGKIYDNYEKAELYIQEAKEKNATYIAFPEFFTTGFATSSKLLESIAHSEDSSKKMITWAKQYQIVIGGSYLYYDGKKVNNIYCLACPDGTAYYHAKDIPTAFEGMYYEIGDDKNVITTKMKDIGVCMCWEMMRYDTIRRMQGKVNFVMAGSCWWELCEGDLPQQMMFMIEFSEKEALNSPVRLAKLLHVPVIHASHSGAYEGQSIANTNQTIVRRIMGATQIVDEFGHVLARRDWTQEPGIIYADINVNQKSESHVLPDEYWISLPKEFIPYWEKVNESVKQYYNKVTLPYCAKNKV